MMLANPSMKRIRLRQPVGTSHFQFLAHQPRAGGIGAGEVGDAGIGAVGSTTPVGISTGPIVELGTEGSAQKGAALRNVRD